MYCPDISVTLCFGQGAWQWEGVMNQKHLREARELDTPLLVFRIGKAVGREGVQVLLKIMAFITLPPLQLSEWCSSKAQPWPFLAL